MKTCLYFSLLSSVIFCNSAYAACTPAPDCASLGYTAFSCPDGGVKCPFDTSKWHCDKSCENLGFKYSCAGNGYSNGVGTVCNGKYFSCNCASGYTWEDGKCKREPYFFTCCSSRCFGYSTCLNLSGYPDCSDAISRCEITFKGKESFQYCEQAVEYVGGVDAAKYECSF